MHQIKNIQEQNSFILQFHLKCATFISISVDVNSVTYHRCPSSHAAEDSRQTLRSIFKYT